MVIWTCGPRRDAGWGQASGPLYDAVRATGRLLRSAAAEKQVLRSLSSQRAPLCRASVCTYMHAWLVTHASRPGHFFLCGSLVCATVVGVRSPLLLAACAGHWAGGFCGVTCSRSLALWKVHGRELFARQSDKATPPVSYILFLPVYRPNLDSIWGNRTTRKKARNMDASVQSTKKI